MRSALRPEAGLSRSRMIPCFSWGTVSLDSSFNCTREARCSTVNRPSAGPLPGSFFGFFFEGVGESTSCNAVWKSVRASPARRLIAFKLGTTNTQKHKTEAVALTLFCTIDVHDPLYSRNQDCLTLHDSYDTKTFHDGVQSSITRKSFSPLGTGVEDDHEAEHNHWESEFKELYIFELKLNVCA